jgi:hypothetical protein
VSIRVLLLVEHDLNYPFTVAQVYEGERSEISPAVNPTHEPYHFTRVLRAEFATVMSAFECSECV